MEPSVWLIAGPTASGKSALALRLAEALAGEIVNADSMQLYRGLSILSAAPSPEDQSRAPHHLYGVADPAEGWSVGIWLRAAAGILREVAERGRPAIVVGGTGLYFRVLTKGLAPIPEIPADRRIQAQQLWSQGGEAAVRAVLARTDAASALGIAQGDRQRLLRALEVTLATGRPMAAWQGEAKPLLGPADWRGVLLSPPRLLLYRRCDERLQAMLEHGALAEVRALVQAKLDPSAPAMKAVGVREFARYLAGEISLEEALMQAQQATRRYVKRQLTWFRHQTDDWVTLADAAEPDAAWSDLKRMWSGSPER